jgi:Fe-S cluster biogenesis protein NfuA
VDDAEVRAQVARVESLLERLDESATEAVAALAQLYGEALRRIVAALAGAPDVAQVLTGDELVSHVLMVHDLHPISLEKRVAQALDDVRPYLRSHGGSVELLDIAGGVARVRLSGTCDGCAASTRTLAHTLETAVLRAAPELHAVEAVEPEPVPGDPRIISLLPGGVVV